MRRSLAFLLAILLLLPAAAALAEDQRLLGTWKSNRKATEWYLTSELNLRPEVVETLGKITGRVTVTYTANKVTFRGGDLVGTFDYEIVSANGNEVQIQIIGPDGMRPPITTLLFTSGKEYWSIPTKSRVRGFRESFRKVSDQ